MASTIGFEVRSLLCVAVAECLRKSIFGEFLIFVVSDQGNGAASIGTIRFIIGYPENVKCPPDNKCGFCTRYKTVWKLAYLGIKIDVARLKR